MNPRSKITTVAMAIALASGVGFLHAQGQGGSSGSVGARDQTNDPLSNNNDQGKAPPATPAANPSTGQPATTNDWNNTQPATSSQNNGNNTTTEQRQDPAVRSQTDPMPMSAPAAGSSSTDTSTMNNDTTDSTLPARADRN
ncbi:hypothetical protein PV762_19700 [Mitsuaria sp. CC2]|jgi:hypothetical protein|uniref:hypothetical protein n=1 Tax=Mitsuaria sp. CC2 TaxID=3029186 RepID=UPI0012051210|nr:MAG: hypothetical protein EOP37_21800 [Rubrivivax sp.]